MQDLTAYMKDMIAVLQATAGEGLDRAMRAAIEAVVVALEQGHPVLIAGNGGSATDAMHIAGELVGRYKRERRGLNVIALSANPAVLTAWANDYDYETIFSRQVEAHGRAGGVFLGISTSGNSKNILAALVAAKDIGMTTIGMTGAGGGKMAGLCDIMLEAQSNDTPHIQEAHICLYHYLCDKIEARLAN